MPIVETFTFAETLRSLRKAANLTQEALAERAGISRRGICDLERGARHAPRPATVRLLSDALGLTDDERAALLGAARRRVESPPDVASEPQAPGTPMLPSGTVTFLFTDIEGSTRLLQHLGSSYAAVLGDHQALLRATFAAHGGVEIDTQGDSFFVAFATATGALSAAVEATQALAAHPWPDGVVVRVRMGLHTGAPQRVGDRYVGLDVHRAARIGAAGSGGQILLSAATAELVRHELPEELTLRDLGPHRLKDLQRAERIYQAILATLPVDFPPLKALDARPHNLPMQANALLGRKSEVEAIFALLCRDGMRLITVTGPGGIGKTRLSLEVAAEALDTFPDGVWNVRLARLTDPTLVIPTIAQAFDLKERGETPLSEVTRGYLQDKRLLLILDNFEQVVVAAPQIGELLAACPGVRALVTSRVPLHLHGEQVYMLRPLALPDPDHLPAIGRLLQYAVVALFIERAQAAQADFEVTNQNALAVAEICARLDGLPLAIELAAARIKLLPPPALLNRLERSLPLLTGGARDLDTRQQTMRATLSWSYGLLSTEEQRLFRRLAVFVGGFTLEAAEAVCVVPEGAVPLEIDVLDGLGALVDQSLVQQREEGGEPRFSLLYVVRQYALEQLQGSGETEAMRWAQAEYVLALAERAEPELTRAEQRIWYDRLEREHDNVRATLGWVCEHGKVEIGLRLVSAIYRFWAARGHMREGQAWVARVLALGSAFAGTPEAQEDGAGRVAATDAGAETGTRARALFAGGWLAHWQGDVINAENWLKQAAMLGQAVGDLYTTAYAMDILGDISTIRGDLERAAMYCGDGLALMREVGDRRGIAVALIDLGEVVYYRGELDQAAAHLTESIALMRAVGDTVGIAVCLDGLGGIARRRGDLAQAETLARQALALNRERNDPFRSSECLESLASVVGARGEGERAARWLGAAESVREEIGTPRSPLEWSDVEEAVASARATLGEEAWAAAYTSGRALSLEQAIAEALGEVIVAGEG